VLSRAGAPREIDDDSGAATLRHMAGREGVSRDIQPLAILRPDEAVALLVVEEEQRAAHGYRDSASIVTRRPTRGSGQDTGLVDIEKPPSKTDEADIESHEHPVRDDRCVSVGRLTRNPTVAPGQRKGRKT